MSPDYRLSRPVPVLQLFGHGEDGVCVDGAVVVDEDDLVHALPVHPRAPAMSAQIVGDAVERIRFGEEVDPIVLIGVHAGGCLWSLHGSTTRAGRIFWGGILSGISRNRDPGPGRIQRQPAVGCEEMG